MEIYLGDVVFAKDGNSLTVYKDGYIVVENGEVIDVYDKLPDKYNVNDVIDYSGKLIIPAFSDLHIHGSQYVQRGVGMDLLLSDWLNNYTFPQEAKFADMNYARPIYDCLVKDLIKNGTFHASIFTTVHRKATEYLFEQLESKGLYALVGKVNQDINSAQCLVEDTKKSLEETEIFLDNHSNCGKVRPIITPRFAPTCSQELLNGLGMLAHKYHAPMQTHLVESLWEASEALNVHPYASSDAEIYQRAGLMDDLSIFAHVIFPTDKDVEIMNNHNSYAIHCPDATNNIIAGIMPVHNLENKGIKIANGSDVGGGHHIGVYSQVARTVQLSKLKEFYEPETNKSVTFDNAFYNATKVGGSAFGKVGSFEPGYKFNALVIDGLTDPCVTLSPQQRLERFCYIGDDRNIVARYIDGQFIEV